MARDPDLPSCVIPKPARGTFKLERARRSREAHTNEKFEKGKVREREAKVERGHGPCRWPHRTEDERVICRREPKEVAHLQHKKSGGDKQTIRSRRHLMIHVCRRIHKLIDAKLGKVEFLDALMKADGALVFLERARVTEDWHEVGRETSPGVLARRAS
jgi:hypothetical protein